MKVYPSEKIRNVVIVGHQGTGKTSVAECMIYNTGSLSRLGKVDEGNSVSDYLPEETKKKISISTALMAFEHKDNKINLLDTPGFMDFYGDVKGCLRIADNLLMVVDAVSGAQVSTELIWEQADKRKTSRFVLVNKMDRENADFAKALDSLKNVLSMDIVPVVIPIGAGETFSGVVDLIDMKAYAYENGKAKEIDVPADMEDEIENYREMLMESAAAGDDDIMEKYLDTLELDRDEIIKGLKGGVKNGEVAPVFACGAYTNIGIDKVVDAICAYGPNPLEASDEVKADEPFAALVFKTMTDPYVGKISLFKVMQGSFKTEGTVYNSTKDADEKISSGGTMLGKTQVAQNEFNTGDIGMLAKMPKAGSGDTLCTKANPVTLDGIEYPVPTLTIAIAPKSKADEDKLGNALARLLEEDPTLQLEKNKETKQTLLTGLGEAHVGIVIERLSKKFGVEVEKEPVKVPYRESIRGTATDIRGRHKKQSGGHGQFGDIVVDMSYCPDSEFEFTETIFGGSVPKNYIPAVEKGFREAMEEGILAGYPVTNIKVNLKDGSYHPVDSSEMAFKIAASLAFKQGCEKAKPILLEPFMNVEVLVPDQFMGDIMGDMNTRRGRVLGMEKSGNIQCIKAQAPLSEMYSYAIDLRSMTQGRGSFTMEFFDYEELPQNLADKVIAAAKAEKE
ncbi:MAG: elongation factor G [Bacillota bacterium]|jgi:elongation factor G